MVETWKERSPFNRKINVNLKRLANIEEENFWSLTIQLANDAYDFKIIIQTHTTVRGYKDIVLKQTRRNNVWHEYTSVKSVNGSSNNISIDPSAHLWRSNNEITVYDGSNFRRVLALLTLP